jgi:hypothetical protein
MIKLPVVLFMVVNGVPSVGIQVMCGSGQIEKQSTMPVQNLPISNITNTDRRDKSRFPVPVSWHILPETC